MHCHLERAKSKLSALVQCSKRLIGHLHEPADADGTSYAGFEAQLRQCRDARALSEGRRVHDAITRRGLERDKYLGNLLVEMYGKCGNVQDAFAAFERISRRNVYSWNIMLTAFAQNGHEQQAIELFWRMQAEGMKADSISLIVVLDACAGFASLASGKRIHHCCIAGGGERDVGVSNALLNMYGKCGSLNDARDVFEGMWQRDVVSWTSVIAAYAQNGHRKQAMEFFEKMALEGEKPNYVTFISVLDACAGLEALQKGKLVHASIVEAGLESQVVLGNTIINMYGKCGDVSCARMVFERMDERSLVSWNAIITAYAQNGHGLEAFKLLERLDLEGRKPDKVTFTSMLEACSSLTTSAHANAVHVRLAAAGYESDPLMSNALISIHGKCGSLDRAREVFDGMQCRNVLSWSAMLAAYAQKGHAKEALELFTGMLLEGIAPNDVTFISVLCACSHAGLVEEGQNYFRSMSEDHGISAVAEHYGCMIDLFGRVGWLDEADAFANMAFQANPVAWNTLLAACRIHGDLNRGLQAAERVLELDPKLQASYLLLSNMYTQ